MWIEINIFHRQHDMLLPSLASMAIESVDGEESNEGGGTYLSLSLSFPLAPDDRCSQSWWWMESGRFLCRMPSQYGTLSFINHEVNKYVMEDRLFSPLPFCASLRKRVLRASNMTFYPTRTALLYCSITMPWIVIKLCMWVPSLEL
jgi:hypothetical protein